MPKIPKIHLSTFVAALIAIIVVVFLYHCLAGKRR